MQTYDISLTITPNLPVWPGDPPIVLETVHTMDDPGQDSNVSRLAISVHTGTHVDAPSHFLSGEVPTVDQLSLRLLTGRAYVLHLPDSVDLITRQVLEDVDVPPRTRRLLFRTRNSKLWADPGHDFDTGFVGIDASGAAYLVEKGVKLVGVDYLSVAPYHDSVPTHQTLLQAGVVILEGLNLSEVEQGRYTLYCLPLKLGGVDGAPARAILVGP